MNQSSSFASYFNRKSLSGQPTQRGRKRTKIVATVGPGCDNESTLRAMFHAGMNVARFNMSHGTHADHSRRLELVRRLSTELQRPVPILVDLQGPKIRLGKIDGVLQWNPGDRVIITVADCPLGDGRRVGTTYKGLAADVKPGSAILVDDGKLRLEVEKVLGDDVHCRVIIGGPVKSNKGINLPDVLVTAPSLSRKDLEDLAWGVANQADFIAFSFVRSADDVRLLRNHLSTHEADIPIIAKIERPEAVANIEHILEAADGIMVARGDLGIEISHERLPVVQKHLIQRANAHGKIVITATQMLESMIEAPIPTRAEASDVANAIFDGTDAVMLSGETASGQYPIEAVETMMRIAVEAENSPYMPQAVIQEQLAEFDHYDFAMSAAMDHLARSVGAQALIMLAPSHRKAQLLSKCRNPKPAVYCCSSVSAWRRAAILWGIVPVLLEEQGHEEAMLVAALVEAERVGMLNHGDKVVVLDGYGERDRRSLRVLGC